MEAERCGWVGEDALYRAYHDEEWGVPERDSRALWEAMQLEGFQAGLSWITILRRREGFRAAFHGFVPEVVADWGGVEIERLMADARIVRHRGKVEATISNARAYLAMERDGSGGFGRFVWSFVDDVPMQGAQDGPGQVPASTTLSTAMAKALKARGFRFCGPTTCYAFMQAVGMVNDHEAGCYRHMPVAAMGQTRSPTGLPMTTVVGSGAT